MKQEDDREQEGPVERRARGKMDQEDSLAPRCAAWQVEGADINEWVAPDRNATYLAEREAIRQRLQRQDLEVQCLREEMAAKERKRAN